MSPDVDSLIAKANALAKQGRYEDAMSLATDMLESHPNEMKLFSLRAYLHACKRDFEQAIIDLTQAIRINAMGPVLFYDRGRYESRLGHFQSAVDDFGRGLELCDHYRNDYYRESLYFFRAEALIELGRKHEALQDLSHVRDDLRTWTYKLRSKSELLAQCAERPS